jgi:hypothetical protein
MGRLQTSRVRLLRGHLELMGGYNNTRLHFSRNSTATKSIQWGKASCMFHSNNLKHHSIILATIKELPCSVHSKYNSNLTHTQLHHLEGITLQPLSIKMSSLAHSLGISVDLHNCTRGSCYNHILIYLQKQ